MKCHVMCKTPPSIPRYLPINRIFIITHLMEVQKTLTLPYTYEVQHYDIVSLFSTPHLHTSKSCKSYISILILCRLFSPLPRQEANISVGLCLLFTHYAKTVADSTTRIVPLSGISFTLDFIAKRLHWVFCLLLFLVSPIVSIIASSWIAKDLSNGFQTSDDGVRSIYSFM